MVVFLFVIIMHKSIKLYEKTPVQKTLFAKIPIHKSLICLVDKLNIIDFNMK